jgi:hypothetical protein
MPLQCFEASLVLLGHPQYTASARGEKPPCSSRICGVAGLQGTSNAPKQPAVGETPARNRATKKVSGKTRRLWRIGEPSRRAAQCCSNGARHSGSCAGVAGWMRLNGGWTQCRYAFSTGGGRVLVSHLLRSAYYVKRDIVMTVCRLGA